MRAAVYIRVSSEEQAREGISLAMQEVRCKEAALRDGAESVEVFRDEGFSGTNTRRPGLQALLARLDDLDAVYTWKLDRLHREELDCLNTFQLFGNHGVVYHSVTETVERDTAIGILLTSIMSAVSAYQPRVTSERIKAAHKRVVEEGRWVGRPPYGYDLARDAAGQITERGVLVVVPEQAQVVKRLFREYAAGRSLAQLAQALNAEGVPRGHGNAPWDAYLVGYILANPAYLGQQRRGEQLHDARHPRLVSATLWRKVQARRQRRANLHPRARDGSLSPLLRCGTCGGHVRKSAGRPRGWYLCAARRSLPASKRHPPVGHTCPVVEAAVWAYFLHLVTAEAIQTAARKLASRLAQRQARSQVGELREELAAVEERLRYNLQAARAGAMPADLLAEENAPVIEERNRLQEKLAQAEAQDVPVAELRDLERLTRRVVEQWADLTIGQKRERLEKVFARVDLHKGHLIVHHRYGGLPPRRIELPRYYSEQRGSGLFVFD